MRFGHGVAIVIGDKDGMGSDKKRSESACESKKPDKPVYEPPSDDRGQTPALEATGFKHFLLDSSPATKRRHCPPFNLNHFIRFYHEWNLKSALIGQGSCRCGCLGRYFEGFEMEPLPLSKNPKEDWITKEFVKEIGGYV